ncbi:hypothetical protein EDB19DRAFT_1909485 [Suillus lakei]|nr:hypothetical protein EDB19DRAFT_1909485 [Suillus lakei]
MQTRKDNFRDNPILPEGLDLVEEEDQIRHQIRLEDELQVKIQDKESDSEESSGKHEDEVVANRGGIKDRTETNLMNLHRMVYLTIMNALYYEEAVHKLKSQIKEGDEINLINMVIECCSQEHSSMVLFVSACAP